MTGVVVGLLTSSPAAAHASLIGSDPLPGQQLAQSPAEVVLMFSESVTPVSFVVLDDQGVPVVAGDVAHPGGSSRELAVPLQPDLPSGVYVVDWSVVSADAHPVSGAFDFAVGAATATGTITSGDAASIAVEVGYSIVRWAGLAGLVVLVGGTFFLLVVWPAGAHSRARVVPLVGAGMAATASIGQLGLQGPYTGQAFADIVNQAFGHTIILRMTLLASAAAVVVLFTRQQTTRADQVVLGLPVAAGLLVTWPLVGHARAAEPAWLAVTADAAHLAAVSVWIGGLVVLVGFVLRRTVPRDEALVVARRFSPIALGCVAAIAATGAYQSWRQVGFIAAFAETGYGQLVTAKLALFAGLIALGWRARRWLHSGGVGGAAALRLSVGFEVIIAASALALASVLVSTEPARTTYVTPHEATLTLEAGDRVEVSVRPAQVGTNMINIVVRGPDGQPRQVPEVSARLTLPEQEIGPLAAPMLATGPGEYAASAVFPYPGRWVLSVTVRTSEFDQSTVDTSLTVR